LNHLVLLVGEHLSSRVRPVLRDHHEGREEDRLQADDHCQQPIRVLLDGQQNPEGEPRQVDVDEAHRPGEAGDHVCDAALQAVRAFFLVLHEGGRQRSAPRQLMADELQDGFRGHVVSFCSRPP